MMTEQQKMWFESLVKDRQDSAKTFEKPSMRGVKTSVVEKYSDQAHFIYELLQNADDAKATFAKFDLKERGLYFTHNGTIHFTVSDPLTEDEDGKNNQLGHINSITSIGSSSKNDQSTIGKFGVGFKAVFQYTEKPHIYDQDFQFKIDRFIVPVKLEKDFIDRQANETVFYFPFDKKEMPADKAYSDILNKLKSLSYPILFLSNLQEVKWTANGETGVYFQKIIGKVKVEGNINYKKLELLQQVGLETKNEKLLLFSKQVEGRVHSYSVGFFLEKEKVKPKNLPAFCFFPTKETTYLNFIIHAPFLLTDSREGIKQSNDWNNDLIVKLAALSADSLLILRDLKLIDDNIINIIPYKESNFCQRDWFNKITIKSIFYPFFEKIKNKFLTESLLPSKNGEFSEKKHAYWASAPNLTELFSNEQLALLFNDKDAKWVFTSLGFTQTQTVDKDKAAFISEIVLSRPYPKDILGRIDSEFTQNQSFNWLHRLYEYLTINVSYKEDVKTKPIFKDSEGNAVAAFKFEAKQYLPILFMPNDFEDSSFKIIHKNLILDKTSKKFILDFGIKEPDLQDEIFNHILPKYESDKEIIDSESHFQKFFKYYKECPQSKVSEFVDLLKDKGIVWYSSKVDESKYVGKASDIYYPSDDLVKYFETKPDTKFVDLDDYYEQIEESDHKLLYEFLLKLGVNTIPKIIKKELGFAEIIKLKLPYYPHNNCFDKDIDGSKELLENIDNQKSLLLWNCLLALIKCNSFAKFQELLQGVQEYKKRSDGYLYQNKFNSTGFDLLTKSKWLYTKNGRFVEPHNITINDLADAYNLKNSEVQPLIEFLQFKPTIVLTPEQRIVQLFGSEEEAKRAKELLDEEKAKQERKTKVESNPSEYEPNELEDAIENLEILSKSGSKSKPQKVKDAKNNTLPDFDEDGELEKGIVEIKEKLEVKKKRIELARAIAENTKYSYQWFEAYLKLLLTYSETQSTVQQKSLSFQKIKLYKVENRNSDKYFLLCGANGYVPQSIEDSEDFKLTLKLKNRKDENITVEGVSKKGQDLLIYCRESIPQKLVSLLSEVTSVEINFTPVVNLLDRLYHAFTNNRNIPEWEDIHDSLPALNYIYGPPGTGKTTTLCKRIDEILQENSDAKFLILTPTNKAADVLCKKLNERNNEILMVRLGRVTDHELEILDSEIYRDSLTHFDLKNINVVSSTIHRLPYFEINAEKKGENFTYNLFRHQYFDYVIFDESSMTGLPYIVFAILALYQTNSKTKFLVAGDPKQIPPVIEINDKELENFDFQDENIYKMMGLESFNPIEQNIRKIDEIINLDKQYRSVKRIGQLFSELSYSKLLKHDREVNRKESKPLPEQFKSLISTTVTFIDIPLNMDNSIYKINKLLFSSYQTYTAILVAEIVKYFDLVNKKEKWTMGLIAPYKAQAILMNKLITSYGISEKIKVYADTVHGFQGDECDIVFFISNPNKYYYTNHPKCLLSKEYIYNVAISRAKDYLIILHPYSTIKDNVFIDKISQSFKRNFGTHLVRPSSEIEKIIFGNDKFIEDNSYVSGHDNVNVFGLTEMKYFIKSSESAIDIQLRNTEVALIDKNVKEVGNNSSINSQISKLTGIKLDNQNRFGKNRHKF
jgi:hypothetical protein